VTFAERARGIVQRAIDDWERVIANFNRSNGNNTYNVVIEAADLGGSARGRTNTFTFDASGKPMSSRITLDDTGGDGGGGWYFDPLVGPAHRPDDSEFKFVDNPFQARNILLGMDFYRTVTHELGHAMGMTLNASRLTSLAIDIGDDPQDSGTAHLFTLDVNGGGPDFTYTSAGGCHLYEGPSVAGCPVHPDELMNSGRAGEGGRRNLISDTDVSLLGAVYGYTTTMPSQLNTFYVNLDSTNLSITINGDIDWNGNDHDHIDLRIGGSPTFIINGTRESVAIPEFFSTVIHANFGNDTIIVDELWGSLEINAGDGNDTLDICPDTRDLIEAPGGITFRGSLGTDSVNLNDSASTRDHTFTITPTFIGRPAFTLNIDQVEAVNLTGQAGFNTFDFKGSPTIAYNFDGGGGADILAIDDLAEMSSHQYTVRPGTVTRDNGLPITFTSNTEIVRFDAGGGDDSFTFFPGDTFGLVGFNGNGGSDSLVIDDRADTGNDDYTHFGNLWQKSLDGVPGGGNLPTTQMQDVESQTFYANNGNNDIVILNGGDGTALRVFAEGGNDTVDLRDGTATVHTGGENASSVFPFGDTLLVNGDASTGEDWPATAIVAQDDEVRDIEVLNANTLGTLRILGGATLMRSAGEGSGFNVLGVIDLAGGALLMRAPAGTLDGWRAGVVNGRNGGAWNGVASNGAINSSLAASTPLSDGVGYGLGSQIGITTIGPFAIGAADTLVRYALDGDANLDGRVNLSDFNRLAANFGGTNRHWTGADFNYDGTTNLADFNLLAGNFGAAVGAVGAAPDDLLDHFQPARQRD
jgi:hypothetical protein